MKISRDVQLIILYSLDEYAKCLKSKNGIKRVESAMSVLEQGEELTAEGDIKIIRTAVRHWLHRCPPFYVPYLEEAKKLMNNI